MRRERPDLPEDLVWLCDRLAQVAPAERPDEGQLRAALELPPLGAASGVRIVTREAVRESPLVGREAELRQLHEALALTDRRLGCGVIVRVHAGSGLGKTSLVQRFLQQAAARQRTVVLAGRCYERESLPYKALDAVVDALAQHLARLPERRRAPLLPPDADALVQLFPVLRQAFPEARVDPGEAPQRLRQRAVGALRALLQALAERRRVVLFIDDAHWGDRDSAVMLEQLLDPPRAPDLLLVLAYRTEVAGRSPLLQALEDPSSALAGHPYIRTLELAPLAAADARLLAAELLGGEAGQPAVARGAGLATESGGNPYLLHELVRYQLEVAAAWATTRRAKPGRATARSAKPALAGTGSAESSPAGTESDAGAPAPGLDEMIRHRVAHLPSRERALLELVAVGGLPLPQQVYHRAARLSGPERAELLPRLQAKGWVRLSGRGGGDRVEPNHDRIRETVVGYLSPARRLAIHRALARALQRASGVPPDTVAEHLLAAGEVAQATRFLRQAAEQAEQTLAFDRAARAYRRLLELRRPTAEGPEVLELTLKLGEALANAGRSIEAGQSFLAAVPLVPAAEQGQLSGRAARALVRGGEVVQGLAVLRKLFAKAGLPLHSIPRGTLLGLLHLALLHRQVQRDSPPRAVAASLELAERIDLAWSLAPLMDYLPGAVFHLLMLSARLALNHGDRRSFCRAVFFAGRYEELGGVLPRWLFQLRERAFAWTRALEDPYLEGLGELSRSYEAYSARRWSACVAHGDRAVALLARRSGASWEVIESQNVRLTALFWLGQLAEVSGWRRQLLQDAQARGDSMQITHLYLVFPGNLTLLAADEPVALKRQLDRALARVAAAKSGYSLFRLYRDLSQGALELYCGRVEGIGRRACQALGRARRSGVLMSRAVAVLLRDLQARCALAEAAGLIRPGWARRRQLWQALTAARRLEGMGEPWTVALARLVRGQAAWLAGDRSAARALLERAAADFDGQQMALHCEVTRYRLGQLLGGSEGEALSDGAVGFLQRQGVVRPERFLAIFAPVDGVLAIAR